MISGWRRALQGVTLAAASVAATLAIAELATRVFVPVEVWRYWRGEQDWDPDPQLGWAMKPNLDVRRYTGQDIVRFRTNPDGLIPVGSRPAKQEGVLRIMLFGDSMVVGRVLPQDQVYSARLEALLGERGIDAEVLNAGVAGYSTDQILLQMQRWLPVYRPDVAVYGSTFNDFGGNEVVRAHGHPKPRFTLGPAGELKLDLPDPSMEIEVGGDPLRLLVQRSALYRWLQPGIFMLRARLGGWEQLSLLGLMQEVYFDPAPLEALDWDLYGALVVRMHEVAEAAGARFFFFEHPDAAEVWDPYIDFLQQRFGVESADYDRHAVERRLSSLAGAAGVPFLAIIDPFLEGRPEGPFHLLPNDPHLSPQGHERLAQVLAEHVILRVLPEIAKGAPARSQ
jgi:lysophospholipase L1-like esterase